MQVVRGGWTRERIFTDKMDLVLRGLKTLRRERDVKDIIRRNERNRMGQWLEQKI